MGLAAAGKLPCIDSYESFIAEVYTEPKPLPKSGKSETASKKTPEVSAPAKEIPADESSQSDNANIPDGAQMEHILELPKATCLLLSLAKMLVFLQIMPVSWRIRERNFFLTLIRKH